MTWNHLRFVYQLPSAGALKHIKLAFSIEARTFIVMYTGRMNGTIFVYIRMPSCSHADDMSIDERQEER